LEDGLLQSLKSKPISSFGDLMAKMTKEVCYSLIFFHFIFITVKDIL